MNEEIWKPVVGYEGLYEVSNKGRVKRVSRKTTYYNRRTHKLHVMTFEEMILLPQMYYRNKYCPGYMVQLRKDRKTMQKSVHVLVASAFIENSENYRYVKHIDGNVYNNCVYN